MAGDPRRIGRRKLAAGLSAAGATMLVTGGCPRSPEKRWQHREAVRREGAAGGGTVKLFLAGDVMTGRGIDQVLPTPGSHRIHEAYVTDARDYVGLAEGKNGPIPKPVDFDYIWGEALEELERAAPDARVINLETAVTTSDAREPKEINYRMHPDNVGCITAAGIDCCVLANNHALDWGTAGLEETLATLHAAKLKTAGAGHDLQEASAPAVLPTAAGARVLVFGFAWGSGGIPSKWGATAEHPGVNYLADYLPRTVEAIGKRINDVARPGDIVVASIHWGPNWGYDIPARQRTFAHALIDYAGVDVVHGHSSHHAKGIEVYRGKPIFYGCGDFINDYEGIEGHDEYRGELPLMYFVTLDTSSLALVDVEMIPMEIHRFRLRRARNADARWLAQTMDREARKLGGHVEQDERGHLHLRWS